MFDCVTIPGDLGLALLFLILATCPDPSNSERVGGGGGGHFSQAPGHNFLRPKNVIINRHHEGDIFALTGESNHKKNIGHCVPSVHLMPYPTYEYQCLNVILFIRYPQFLIKISESFFENFLEKNHQAKKLVPNLESSP